MNDAIEMAPGCQSLMPVRPQPDLYERGELGRPPAVAITRSPVTFGGLCTMDDPGTWMIIFLLIVLLVWCPFPEEHEVRRRRNSSSNPLEAAIHASPTKPAIQEHSNHRHDQLITKRSRHSVNTIAKFA